jgi:hypothetical protein
MTDPFNDAALLRGTLTLETSASPAGLTARARPESAGKSPQFNATKPVTMAQIQRFLSYRQEEPRSI